MASESVKKLHEALLANPDVHIRLVNAIGELRKAVGEPFSPDDLFRAIVLAKEAYEQGGVEAKSFGAEFQQHYEELVAR